MSANRPVYLVLSLFNNLEINMVDGDAGDVAVAPHVDAIDQRTTEHSRLAPQVAPEVFLHTRGGLSHEHQAHEQLILQLHDSKSRAAGILQAQREARRLEKSSKKAARQAAKLQNSLRCDARFHVRLAAAAKVASLNEAGLLQPQPAQIIARIEEGEDSTATGTASRRSVLVDAETSASTPNTSPNENMKHATSIATSLFGLDLREFSLQLVVLPQAQRQMMNWACIRSLDLSHNELSALPGIELLTGLEELDLCRNQFRSLPPSLQSLQKLSKLNVSRNDIRPTLQFLQMFLAPPGFACLQELDLTFNKRCFKQELADLFAKELPTVAVRMTVTCPPPPGAKIGELASDRDPSLLRSQLEPYTTLQLRQRLVSTFQEEPYAMVGPSPPARAQVMERLLQHYSLRLGVNADGAVQQERKLVRVNGTPINPPELLDQLLTMLREWAARHADHQERPNVRAQTYMILRSPSEFEKKFRTGSGRATAAKRKFEQNEELWRLAARALASVDPEFAAKFTGLAITRGFKGSPHIDTTNIGPFYGLAMGDYADGTGGIRVELDAMTVAEVNTKNRLGKVDGRFPHWVAPYDENCERFSLIFYQTEGDIVPQESAVFSPIIDVDPESCT